LVKLSAFEELVPKRVHQREVKRASKLAQIASQAERIVITNVGTARKIVENVEQVKLLSRAYVQQEIARLQQYDPHLQNAKEFIATGEEAFCEKHKVTDVYLQLLRRYCHKLRNERRKHNRS
jgi:hypothetical protein